MDLISILLKNTSKGIEFTELYLEKTKREVITLDDGRIKDISRSEVYGCGARAVQGERVGYAYTDDPSEDSIKEALKAAQRISVGLEGSKSIVSVNEKKIAPIYDLSSPLIDVPLKEKVDFLLNLNELGRSRGKYLANLKLVLFSEVKEVTIVNSEGLFVSEKRPLLRLSVQAIASKNGELETATSGGGGRYGFLKLKSDDRCEKWVQSAVERAYLNLSASYPEAGNFDVVLGNGWSGIILHEAVGHGLEGDHIRKKLSAFYGKLGTMVASPLCTVIDDGTIPERRGSLSFDDEGTETKSTVLIENGKLVGFMYDTLNGKLSGVASTGNGRRQNYQYPPIPRMTNTYLKPGSSSPDDLIASVKKGFYIKDFSGGQVDISSGKFVFSASEAFMIENGKITKRVKGATLIGSGPEVLKKVVGVANDFELDSGIGTCGKDGQSVPVGVGIPTILVKNLLVGGHK